MKMKIIEKEAFGQDLHIWIEAEIMKNSAFGPVFATHFEKQDEMIFFSKIITPIDYSNYYVYIGDELDQSKIKIHTDHNHLDCRLNYLDYEFATQLKEMAVWESNFKESLKQLLTK